MAEAQRQGCVRRRAGFKHLRFATPARAPLHDLTLAQECLAAQPSKRPTIAFPWVRIAARASRRFWRPGHATAEDGVAYLRCER